MSEHTGRASGIASIEDNIGEQNENRAAHNNTLSVEHCLPGIRLPSLADSCQSGT